MSVAVPSEGSEREPGAPSPDAHLTARHRVGKAKSALRKFSFATQHPGRSLVAHGTRADPRLGGSVGDVAAAGPSGVLSIPRAAVSHSGGVRRHRRYVFAPVIPLLMRHRPAVGPGRGRSEVRVGRVHRVGGYLSPARVAPHSRLVPAYPAGKRDLG